MDAAWMTSVNAMTDGMVRYATRNFVIRDATSTVSAKMERVCASPDGMENIAHWKDVREGKTNDSLVLDVSIIPMSLNSCSSHGQCRVGGEGLFECRCNDGWDGIDCSLPLEKDCKDGKDNDKGKRYFQDSSIDI